MSLLGATILTAIATLALAVFALATAILAFMAWRKQSREVSDQARMLRVQSGQLELQRQNLEEQQKTAAKQAEVLELQAAELRESLEERKREAEGTRSAQASRVFLILDMTPLDLRRDPEWVTVTAEVVNRSDQPAYSARINWPSGTVLSDAWAPNPESLGDVLPGKSIQTSRSYPTGWDRDLSDLAFRFTDAAGVGWVRRANGYLGEQE